jgi:Holliday junction DNA helicase RuvA
VIAFVRGTVAQLGLTSVVVDLGSVGIEVQCTPGTIATLRTGGAAQLPTSLVVREDSLTVFGFLDEDEKQLFELVQTASGVGPKLAQAMLAVLSPDELRRAVATEDVKSLTRVPGIGQKGAQRIILELKDRVGPPLGSIGASTPAPVVAAEPAWRVQVRAGLTGLGWSAKEAERALDLVADSAEHPEGPESADVGALLRQALRALSRA